MLWFENTITQALMQSRTLLNVRVNGHTNAWETWFTLYCQLNQGLLNGVILNGNFKARKIHSKLPCPQCGRVA